MILRWNVNCAFMPLWTTVMIPPTHFPFLRRGTRQVHTAAPLLNGLWMTGIGKCPIFALHLTRPDVTLSPL